MDLTTALCYASANDFMKDNLCFPGACRTYYTSGTPGPHASWITAEEISTHKKIFAAEQGGYGPPLAWYKCQMANLNTPDEARVPEEDYYLKVPTLLIKCMNDPVGVPLVQETGMKPWIDENMLKVIEIESGHWCLMEKPNETNEALEKFVENRF